MRSITEIHERLYEYLMKRYEKDDNFRFTLRSTNHGGKLNLGYWFLGDDSYLTFSFWKSSVWHQKTSNIAFVVANDGTSTLELVALKNEKKVFFSKIADALDMQQKKSINDESRWVKDYKGADYISSLETFIKRDKAIIDAFIHSNNMQKIFTAIPKEEFTEAALRIDKVKNHHKVVKELRKLLVELNSESFDSKPIKIQALTIKNISLFKSEQTIEFHKNLTCFIGLNGTGKTSLLKALVLAFTGFEQNEKLGPDKIVSLNDKLQNLLHIVGEKRGNPIYANNGFAEVSYTIQMNGNAPDEYKNSVNLRKQEDEVIISDDSNSDFRSIIDDRYKCLFIAIPQLQGETKSSINKEKRPLYPNVNDAISMLSGHPEDRFSIFADWLRRLNNVANDKQVKGERNPFERQLLNDIFKVISKITGEEVTLHKIFVTIDADIPDPIWVNIGNANEPILLDLVSQGYNSVFSFIGNILQRLVEVTPKGSDYKQTSAIVLIDEIDTYLHPQWQYTILDYLVESLPNVQFIVTTHSPYVVGSIPNDKIKIYICEKEGFDAKVEAFEPIHVYGSKLDLLNELVFKTPSRIKKVAPLVSQMRTSIQQSDFDAFETIKKKLVEIGIDIQTDAEISSLISLANTKKRMAKV